MQYTLNTFTYIKIPCVGEIIFFYFIFRNEKSKKEAPSKQAVIDGAITLKLTNGTNYPINGYR